MVEDVAVQDIETLGTARVDIIALNTDVGEMQREDAFQKIVVVASQVDDLRVMLDLQQAADEIRVAAFPLLAAAAEQFPAVDDVAAQDQCIAGVILQKTVGLFGFRPFRSKVDVRHHDGLEVFGFGHRTPF